MHRVSVFFNAVIEEELFFIESTWARSIKQQENNWIKQTITYNLLITSAHSRETCEVPCSRCAKKESNIENNAENIYVIVIEMWDYWKERRSCERKISCSIRIVNEEVQKRSEENISITKIVVNHKLAERNLPFLISLKKKSNWNAQHQQKLKRKLHKNIIGLKVQL